MPRSVENEKDKLSMNAKKAALAVLAGAAVIAGVNATKKPSVEVPKVADSTTEYVAQGPEVKIEGLNKGDTVRYFPGTFELDLGKGNVRSGPSVLNDDTNGEDNTVNLQGVVNDKVELQNPILYDSTINGVSNPNGRILQSTVDRKTIYVFVDAVNAVGGVEDAKTGEQAIFDETGLAEGIIVSTRTDGVKVEGPNNEEVTIATTFTPEG